MARVGRGERLAFEALYSRYGSPVMRFLFRLCGDRTLAEDLTQDVFLKVWRAAPRWRPIGKVPTWIFQIARRHWWNEGAKRARRRAVDRPAAEGHADDTAARSETAERRLARAEIQASVEQAVAGLSRRLRVIFVLVRLEGLALTDAAQVAGIPVGTVKSRLAAAEKQLRRRLSHLLE